MRGGADGRGRAQQSLLELLLLKEGGAGGGRRREVERDHGRHRGSAEVWVEETGGAAQGCGQVGLPLQSQTELQRDGTHALPLAASHGPPVPHS